MTPAPTTRMRALIVGCLLAADVIACSGADANDPVATWLACECPAELQWVVSLGDAVVPRLEAALRNGPTPVERQNYTAQMAEEYRLAKSYRDKDPSTRVLSDSATYVSLAVNRMVIGYQKRAAWALRSIGTPLALLLLRGVSDDLTNGVIQLPPEVTAMLRLLDDQFPITAVSVLNPGSGLAMGGTVQLSARVYGAGNMPQFVTWSSASTMIVVVDQTGRVTGVGAGDGIVRACSVARPLVCGVTQISMP